MEGSPDGTFSSSKERRWAEVYLRVSRLPLSEPNAAARSAGLHLYDMNSCDARSRGADELISIEDVREQVYLGVDPRRGQDSEADFYLVQSKGSLQGREVITNGVSRYGL